MFCVAFVFLWFGDFSVSTRLMSMNIIYIGMLHQVETFLVFHDYRGQFNGNAKTINKIHINTKRQHLDTPPTRFYNQLYASPCSVLKGTVLR